MKDKLIFEPIALNSQSPVIARNFDYDHFFFPLHYHDEFEILYIKEGTGTTFVADGATDFAPGTIILFGSGIPHYSKSSSQYYQNNPNYRLRGSIIQFEKEFMSHPINNYPEFRSTKNLLEQSSQGICFPPECKKLVSQIEKTTSSHGFLRLTNLLQLLFMMSQSQDFRTIGSVLYNTREQSADNNRLKKILTYLEQHYLEEISLEEVAEIGAMNNSSFCRFFKDKTGKTLIQYIIEMRIAYACELLNNTTQDIFQISFTCGFNSISHFNKIFKRITQVTPSHYRTNNLAKMR